MAEGITTNKSEGYIKIFRSLKKHWLWQDEKKLKWWLDILLTANHADQKVNIGFEIIECKRGQSVKSLQTWAKEWGVDKSTVRRFFKMLQDENMICTENVQKTTRLTVRQYCDYNDWRHDEQPMNNRKTTRKQLGGNPNNNVNNDNNDKNSIDAVASFSKEPKGDNSEKENLPPDPPSLYALCVEVYDEWLKDRFETDAKIDGQQGKAMKSIISYLKTAVKKRNNGSGDLTNKVLEEKTLVAWRLVLNHFDDWTEFQKGRTKLSEISSDLQNILIQVKNGVNASKSANSNKGKQNGASSGRGASIGDLQALKRNTGPGSDERSEFSRIEVIK